MLCSKDGTGEMKQSILLVHLNYTFKENRWGWRWMVGECTTLYAITITHCSEINKAWNKVQPRSLHESVYVSALGIPAGER